MKNTGSSTRLMLSRGFFTPSCSTVNGSRGITKPNANAPKIAWMPIQVVAQEDRNMPDDDHDEQHRRDPVARPPADEHRQQRAHDQHQDGDVSRAEQRRSAPGHRDRSR